MDQTRGLLLTTGLMDHLGVKRFMVPGYCPWNEPRELIPMAVGQVRSFLRAHRPD